MSYSLNLLGGAVLESPEGPVTGRAAHKRRLALLAVLALARGRTVARERIVGLLWPEHPGDAARHLLSESLYVLRKELGEGALTAVGGEIGLNPGVVRCDAAELQAAIEAGDAERAAALYRGPLLDGFVVSDAPEFERWAEAERDRLARLHLRAVERLAEAAEAAGRTGEAVDWWRRLAVQDPYNGRVALRLMRALDAAGERAAALWFAQMHATLLREELGTEPDAELTALAERLRTEPARAPAPPPPPPPEPLAPAAPAPPIATVEPALDDVRHDAPPETNPPPAAPPPAAPPAAVPPAAEPLRRAAPPSARAGIPVPHRARIAAAVAGLALGLAAAGALRGSERAQDGEAAGPYDPRRIAVLYFDDHSPGGELAYLATGLTESLIHALSQVRALEVISRNGVKPYRDTPVRFDSMAAALRAGSIVEGSVQRVGDSVRVTVQLVDAGTNAHLGSRTLMAPLAGVMAMEEPLAEEVAAFLRRRLGHEIAVREARVETRSDEAWMRVMEAERARDDAAGLARSRDPLDLASAALAFRAADSLLALAEAADPGWTRPTLLRGWVAHRRSLLPGAEAERDRALAAAERVLHRTPAHPQGLELRGAVRMRAGFAAPPGGQAPLLDAAERDLRGAVAADPALASAWAKLSRLLLYRARFAEADLAARRALAEDAYLEDADLVMHRVFLATLLTGDYPRAEAACDQGRRRFSADWRFHECRLTLLREDTARAATPAEAWAVMRAVERVDPPATARAEGRTYTPAYRLALVAALLARAGEADSARAVLARARRIVRGDDAVSLDYDEAYVRLVLGEREAARRLLDGVLARRPALRPFAARDPLLRELVPAPVYR